MGVAADEEEEQNVSLPPRGIHVCNVAQALSVAYLQLSAVLMRPCDKKCSKNFALA